MFRVPLCPSAPLSQLPLHSPPQHPDNRTVRALRSTRGQIHLDPRSPDPIAGAGDAIVRVLRAAISPLDLAVVQGHIPHEGVLGHEFVGIVERIEGDPGDPSRALIGKRVVGQPEIVCAACDLCRAGLSRHCRSGRMLGIGSWPGVIAERIAIPARNLVPIPDTLDADAAVLAEPLCCAMHAAQIVRIVGKTYVTVLGEDAHALLMAQVMARENASVRVLGDRPERLGIAEKWGVKHRHAAEVGRRADQDVVVCSSPDAAMLDLAMGLVRPRGKIVLRGMPGDASRWRGEDQAGHGGGEGGGQRGALDLSPIITNELEVIGARGGRIADAIAALESKRYDVGSLVTRRFKLADAVAAMRAASEPDAMKIVVECAPQ